MHTLRLKIMEVIGIMLKKAVIVISLVEESVRVANEEIEKEMLRELSKRPS